MDERDDEDKQPKRRVTVSWAVYPRRPSRPSTIVDIPLISFVVELAPKKCISKEKFNTRRDGYASLGLRGGGA